MTCSTAAGMGNFISSLLILEASESCTQGTDRCTRCSGMPSLVRPCHCPHLRGSGDGRHGSVCGPGLGPGTNAGAEVTVMGRGKARHPAVLGWEGEGLVGKNEKA